MAGAKALVSAICNSEFVRVKSGQIFDMTHKESDKGGNREEHDIKPQYPTYPHLEQTW
jgi:hypothetical protein